ncbi:hypothetical protein VTN77DRAFT_8760 [Rasamsonia byssochlamydoides]|uniref:uncharacterized protein n=1 Tax=Rasamsonia byssochlamydoides TaxID=89139 RepID=UPI003741F6A7
MLLSKGRTLGGSSAINLGMIVYPSKVGINGWKQLGNPGWGWDDLAPYIRKFQTATGPSQRDREFLKGIKYDQRDQGSDGPVQVSFCEEYMPYHAAWLETFKNLGFPLTEDPINGAGKGAFINPSAVDPNTRTRSHSGTAYFGESAQKRPNLRVVTGALVEKLLLRRKGDFVVATGVQASKGGNTYKILVTKDVILAAGATQTPQILELSGIGDADRLRAHGIDMVVDNKSVGENLQDHGSVSFGYEVADGMLSGDMVRNPDVAAEAMAKYQKDGSGPLGMVPFAAAFLSCLDAPPELRTQLQQQIDSGEKPTAQKKQYEVLRQLLTDTDEPTAEYILAPFQMLPREGPCPKGIFGMSHPGHFITILCFLSYPLSRGSVHLQSADPKEPPAIDSGILLHPVDLELTARHAMWTEKIAETEPMASLLKKGGQRLHAPTRVTDLEKAKELCKELVMSMYHVSGSCAMMPREDGGVVDPRLTVYATKNVRVVDASIFPLVPRGNIQATVFAVAEKAADIIKEDYGIASG